MTTEFPPVFYVPCTPDAATGQFRVTLRRTKDDRVALLGYTALDRLRAGAGETQWALLNVAELQKVHDETPYDVIFLDVRIPDEFREVTA